HADRTAGIRTVFQAGFLNACQNTLYRRIRTVIIKVVKIQTVGLPAVIILIDQLIIVDPHGGANALQQTTCLCIGCVGQTSVGVLIIRQAADYYRASSVHIITDYLNEIILKYAGLRLSG